jgi:ABC-type bacteriocin/lantibiotic exporter with double-glycine peptidase domain
MFKSYIYYLKKIYLYNKNLFILAVILSIVGSATQVFGIASIYPVIALVTNPDLILQNRIFNFFFNSAGLSKVDIIFYFSIGFLVINIISVVVNFIYSLVIIYISRHVSSYLNLEVFSRMLNGNDKRNSFNSIDKSTVLNALVSESGRISLSINAVLSSFQNITSIFLFLFLIIFIAPSSFFIILLVFGSYVFINIINKKFIKKSSYQMSYFGKKLSELNLYLTIGLKDMLTLNIGKKIISLHKYFSYQWIKYDVIQQALTTYSKYVVEIAIFFIIILFFNYSHYKNNIYENIPALTILAMAIWRSIPIFFSIFRNLATLQSNVSTDVIFRSIIQDQAKIRQKIVINNFKKKIEVLDATYSYRDSKKTFRFNYSIKKGDKVLVSGNSGTGKSTFLNILSGMSKPDSGKILYDNKDIYRKYSLKPGVIGYVTQHNLIFAGNVIENICFKKKSKLTRNELKNLQKIIKVLNLQNIGENLEELNLSIDAPEISGGQKQRIAIARVLYSNPQILVLDESTSALDINSERSIIENILKYYPKLTLILSSHRISKKYFNKKILIKS